MSTKDSKRIMRVQRRKKINVIDKFGGECCLCGYKKCINALEFHHLDKDKKEENPAYIIMRWSYERAKKELDKCILVCSNCHREIHYLEIDVDLRQYRRDWISKECPQCNDYFDTKKYDQIYCTIQCSQLGKRKVNRPSKSDLRKLLDQKIAWTKLGKMFGVSDNAVRKWARKYKLI